MDTPYADRRRYPRVRLLKALQDQTVAVDPPFVLHDVSLGGFCIEAPFEFPLGAVHEFRFVVSGGPVNLTGTVKHCLRMNRAGDGTSYQVGFEFVIRANNRGRRSQRLFRPRFQPLRTLIPPRLPRTCHAIVINHGFARGSMNFVKSLALIFHSL
jgi:hypothetical protein